MYQKLKLGFAPTRRNVFSKKDAHEQRILIEKKLKAWNVDYVGLDWLNEEGLIYDPKDSPAVAEHFKKAKVDAIFAPHVNFGTEEAVAKLSRELDVPLLLWGPRDDAPLPDGSRTRDTQCGLFATGKLLRRFGVPFTYIVNSSVDDPLFERGFKNFLAAASVVRAFRNMKIGVISNRPRDFWTVINNEGELLEKFGIELIPTTLIDIVEEAKKYLDSKELDRELAGLRDRVDYSSAGEESFKKVLTLKIVMERWAVEERLSGIAIQCWNALQKAYGVMPCFAHSLLSDNKIPVACETDVHGAISMELAQAATMYRKPSFLADLTIRHPTDDNAELLWHCGPFLLSLAKEKPYIGKHFILDSHSPGVSEWEIKGGKLSVLRFDGDFSNYKLFVSHAESTDGPFNKGTYVWAKFRNWPKLEEKLVCGPYIHHVAGVHDRIMPVIYEAVKYMKGVELDPGEPGIDEVQSWLRHEIDEI
ncbi:MAG TPA: L-fucose/L-arabinose isomerase family protein [Mesotoga infera]|nr:L-fucose/L-arabinose isomerase family protein [Mesotoga infera]